METIEAQLRRLLHEALLICRTAGLFTSGSAVSPTLSSPKQESHGDFTTNIAFELSRHEGKSPRQIAEAIVAHLPPAPALLTKTTVAGGGFINFSVHPSCFLGQLHEIFRQQADFGRVDIGKQRKVLIEFVSANPTGPLHIGHGRGAVYGDVLGNLFSFAGFRVTKEYYVNDTGVQMETLGRSVYLRLCELMGEQVQFPPDAYQGEYIREFARGLSAAQQQQLRSLAEGEAIGRCGTLAGDKILKDIQEDLALLGIVHDHVTYEHALHAADAIERALDELRRAGYLYEEGGALWFRSTQYGDDKDRVLKKSDGSLTYFAADIAYHQQKFSRGFDLLIDIWGADHGGYVARLSAAVQAMGHPAESFRAILIQLVNLVRDGKLVSMSTRSATYETLEDVRTQVGKDVCRYFFLMRSHTAQLDFDLDLARKESPENPVYYIQYAHARIASIFTRAALQGIHLGDDVERPEELLSLPEEIRLAKALGTFPRVIETCVEQCEPHHLAFYLLEVARLFQGYYSRAKADSRYRVLSDDAALTRAKLYLLKNIQIVLQNGLSLLGISAPERMDHDEEG